MSHQHLLGAHVSIAGGLEKAIERGESIACTAIQIFTKSNRQWKAKDITQDEALLFKEMAAASSIKSIIAHAAYLINLGSANKEVEKKSIDALVQELERCDQLAVPYLVIHPGGSGTDTEASLAQIARNLDLVLDKANTKTKILLEIMAGQGGSACYRFEHLASIINLSKWGKNMGVCFDTCHAFAAGYDFSDKANYNAMWQQFDSLIGLEKLKAIHLNDSKKNLGSRVDRHDNIGRGKIGLDVFTFFMNDKRFSAVPKILETPEFAGLDLLNSYKINLEVLRNLI